MARFTVAENFYSGKRVSWVEGKLVVSTLRKPMSAENKKLVESAHVSPETTLAQITKLVASGKFDVDAIKAILNEKPDFDKLVAPEAC